MGLSEALLPEFDHEMANTRKTLERVPDDKLGWKPHEKSFSMHDLAVHLATIPHWGGVTINEDSFDVAPPDAPPYELPKAESRQEILDLFDKSVAQARAALADASDEHWFKTWSLLSGGNAIFALPRVAVFRSFVMNHNVHHRAQLGVYLRLNDIPVPSIYGPSADESGM
jgi:uncharacterized damage-inducible protein DinB